MSSKKTKQIQDNELEILLKEKSELEGKIKRLEEIAVNTQSQYMNLKYDFESLRDRVEKEKRNLEAKILSDNLKKFIPMVEELRKMVETVPESLWNDAWAKWAWIVYTKVVDMLSSLWVIHKDSIWQEPNTQYHIPIGTEQSQDQKWKIIKEFERCYILKKWEDEFILNSAKVIVWV